jgi:hypothetical protein
VETTVASKEAAVPASRDKGAALYELKAEWSWTTTWPPQQPKGPSLRKSVLIHGGACGACRALKLGPNWRSAGWRSEPAGASPSPGSWKVKLLVANTANPRTRNARSRIRSTAPALLAYGVPTVSASAAPSPHSSYRQALLEITGHWPPFAFSEGLVTGAC